MAMSLQEQLRAKRAEAERWIREREAEVRRAGAAAEVVGRQIYDRAIKTGERVVARTPSEIRQLGAAALQGRLPQALGGMVVKAATSSKATGAVRHPTAATKPGSRPPSTSTTLRRQIEAGVSGLVDEASFGLADHALAAGEAIGAAIRDGELNDVARDYDSIMASKRAADQYDAQHFGLARNVGRATGFVGSVALAGAPGMGRAILARVPKGRVARQVAELGLRYGPDPRGLTAMSALGGTAAGAIDQVVGDTIAGRQTTVRDLAAAGTGGALGGVATRFLGPGFGGQVVGGSTSVLGDIANRREVSLENAARSAQLGGVLGAVGGEVGVRQMSNLGSRAKGRVGDTLSEIKAIVRGERLTGSQQRIKLEPTGSRDGGYTVADVVSINPRTGRPVLTEAKMGPWASLSPRQIQARNQFGDDYVTDFWSFSDVGKASGAAIAPVGAGLVDRSEPPRR